MDIAEAIQTLTAAGAVFSLPPENHLSLAQAGKRIDFSSTWVRKHLKEFPNRWRAPGGEWRIPVRDVEAMAARLKAKGQS